MRRHAPSLTPSPLPFALFAALCGFSLVPACSSHACGVVGCGIQAASIQLTLPPPTATTFPLNVRACLNEDCRMAQLAQPGSSDAGSDATFPSTPPMPDGRSANATLSPAGAGSLALVVAWGQYPSVTDANGATMTSFDKTATYTTSYPNGKDCDLGCKSAVFE